MGSGADTRYFVIMNPGSHSGESKHTFAEIRQAMKRRRLHCRYARTRSLNHAEQLSRRAAAGGYDVIVAVGGDGTINRVINGLYNRKGERISAARLGVIYTGTSPDFCKSHGIPIHDVKRAVQVLAAGHTKSIGIGRIRFRHGRSRVFACCANIGLGAQLAQAANSGIRGKVGDKAGTFLSLIRVLSGYQPSELTVNGRRMSHVYNLSVGKTRYIASGLKVNHRLPAASEAFYLLCVRNRPIGHVARLYSGIQLPLKYGKRIVVKGRAEVEFDGDVFGRLPVIITPAPAIEVIYERT